MSTLAESGARRRIQDLDSTTLVYVVLVATIIIGAILTSLEGRNFFSLGNIASILTLTSTLGFIAVGQTLVILAGSLDLSVPYVVSLTSLVGGTIMAGQSQNMALGIVAALAIAAVIGLINGLVVTSWKVHGFIATLGMGLIINGYLASNYQGSAGSAPSQLKYLGALLIGPIPFSTIVLAICAAGVWLLLRRTPLGHHLYAVGGDHEVARLSGVRVAPPVIAAHVLCSMLTALAGLLLLARTSVGSPTVGSQGGYDLMSIAAVVLGGTILAGGRGSVLGTIGGVAIFAVMDNVMGVMQVNPFLRDVVRGVVIVVAVAVYARRNLQVRPARFVSAGQQATRPDSPRQEEPA